MKKSRLFIAALCAVAGISACNNAPVQPELTEYTITVEASMAPETKGLSLNGKTLNAVWIATDKVTVFNGSSEIGTLTPQSTGSATATLKGSITGSVSVGTTLTLHTPRKSWIYNTNQDGTLSNLKNFAYARATVTVTSVSGGNVSTSAAHFDNQQAMVKFTLLDGKGSTLTVDELKIEAASNKLVRIIADDGTASYGSITVENDDEEDFLYAALRNESGAADTYILTATVGKNIYTCTKSGVLLENGKYYSIKATMDEEVQVWTVAGAPAAIFGKEWDPTYTANDMAKQSDGTYVKVYNVTTATEASFKVVKDHDPDYTVAYPGENWSHAVGVGEFKIIYDPSNNNVSAQYVDPGELNHVWTVAGTPASVFGTEWDPSNQANDMTLVGGVYTKTYNNVPSGTALEFKVAADHTWTLNYGAEGKKGGANVNHTMSATKSLTITFNPSTFIISASEK